VACKQPAAVIKAKKAIVRAFQHQIKRRVLLVEILSPCPTNWKMDPIQSCNEIDEVMVKEFPLG